MRGEVWRALYPSTLDMKVWNIVFVGEQCLVTGDARTGA